MFARPRFVRALAIVFAFLPALVLATPSQAAPAPAMVGVKIIKAPGVVTAAGYARAFASLTVKTAPKANCSIRVVYKTGVSTAAGLGPKQASATGTVSWTWRVGTSTAKGTWPITVSCVGQGSARTTITIK